MHWRGASWFCRKLFVSRNRKTSYGVPSEFQNISSMEENLWIRGVSQVSVEKFLSHCTKIFHWRTLRCFRKILLSKIFMHKRGASRFCRNFLSHSTKTKSFVKEPFCFPEYLWYRKKFMDKRGHITIFSRNFYVSQCRKIS